LPIGVKGAGDAKEAPTAKASKPNTALSSYRKKSV